MYNLLKETTLKSIRIITFNNLCFVSFADDSNKTCLVTDTTLIRIVNIDRENSSINNSHTRRNTKTRIHDFVHSRNHRQIIIYHGLIYMHTYLYKFVNTSMALYSQPCLLEAGNTVVPPSGVCKTITIATVSRGPEGDTVEPRLTVTLLK